MGANPTQAQGVVLFFIAFILIAAGFASGGSIMYIAGGLVLLAVSCGLFIKCKPWEHRES
jgi:glucose dehydrogenase